MFRSPHFRALFLIVLFAAMAPVHAQEDGLPHQLAPSEIPLIEGYRLSRGSLERGITAPPAFPVRTMAEWEEVSALVVTWRSYEGILKQIVRYAKDECEVIVVCDDSVAVKNYLLGNSFGGPLPDLNNITYLEEASNSIWVRDYGAETIYRNEVDTLMLLDWIYNRPRPADDAVSDVVASHLGLPIYSTTQAPYDLVHTGGNFMSDGAGTAFSSELVLEENGANGQFNQTVRTPAQVDDMMETFMGIQQGRYVKMTTLPYDDIHHIDMHMKLLDEETLLIGEFPVGVSDGPQLEMNIQGILSNYSSVYGTPYRIIRIPMVPSTGGNYPPQGYYRTYANNVFINRTVLVPTYRTQYDTTGLRIIRESLPGYRVIGIDCDDAGANIISASGAIHCITKTIGVEDPLLIRHQRLVDTYDTQNGYVVDAYIRHRSGIASAQLHWTTDTAQGFSSLPMTALGADMWSASIPAQMALTDVFYYIEANANSGKVQVRPLVAPEGWWKFRVLDINTALNETSGPEIAEVFPNPTRSLVMVTMGMTGPGPVDVYLADALGRKLMVLNNGPLPADQRVFADLSALEPGAYLIVASNASGRAVKRVVRQ